MDSTPLPWQLNRVDMTAKEIHLPVVVLGSAAHDLCAALHRQTRAADAEAVDLARPGEASFTYLPLRLGDVRGFATHLHLYGFETDPRLGTMLGEYARAAAGAILAFRDAPDADGAALVAVMARSIPAKIPVAALGPPEVAKSWVALHDTPAIATAPVDEASFLPALKSLTAEMLSALRSGSSAPSA